MSSKTINKKATWPACVLLRLSPHGNVIIAAQSNHFESAQEWSDMIEADAEGGAADDGQTATQYKIIEFDDNDQD